MMPPQIAVRNVQLPPEAEADIRKRIVRLGRFYDRLMSCRVTVSVPTRRRRSDAIQYGVRIDLTLPRGEIVVDRQPREELRTAVQEAFDAARRRLRRYVQRLHGDVKTHEHEPRGRVSQYYPLGGYGFIEAPDGREIYFDKRSVLNGGFDRLDVGAEVRFSEEAGEKGPQATSVALVARQQLQHQD